MGAMHEGEQVEWPPIATLYVGWKRGYTAFKGMIEWALDLINEEL